MLPSQDWVETHFGKEILVNRVLTDILRAITQPKGEAQEAFSRAVWALAEKEQWFANVPPSPSEGSASEAFADGDTA